MNVSFVRLVGPEWMVAPMRITQGKEFRLDERQMPGISTWGRMLATCGGTPHSPVRAVIYRIYAFDVPSWVATHYSRHHVGIQPYIQSQRTDNKDADYNRDDSPQGAFVNMLIDMNANSIINVAKARLCNKAAPETRKLFELLKISLYEDGDKYDRKLSELMQPPCKWYLKCFEPSPCKKLMRG
jgi:hypothetical protein